MKGMFTARERQLIYTAYGEAFEESARIVDANAAFPAGLTSRLRAKATACYALATDLTSTDTTEPLEGDRT